MDNVWLKLNKVNLFLVDMDGTFYLGEKILPGSLRFIKYLEAIKKQFLFLTNNSSKSAKAYATKIRRMGADILDDQIFTSGQAAAIFLNEKKLGRRIYLVGTNELNLDFIASGFDLVENGPDCVVLGFDTTLTYEKLRRICDFIRQGLPYIATHPDINCPTEDGLIPDIGSVIAFIETSTGRRPDIIIGKPHHPILDIIVKKFGVPAHEIAIVGDRLYTDIALGEYGIITILVLSGETKLENVKSARIRPDLVTNDLSELTDILQNIRETYTSFTTFSR